MGGASSSILVGFSWLYGSSGGEIKLQEIVNGLINTQMYNSPKISIALIFITVGIGFKLSPAPSHQWTPDVYEGKYSNTPPLSYIPYITLDRYHIHGIRFTCKMPWWLNGRHVRLKISC
ncbi:hypothetical protein Gotur_024610 [Gossypium turneri]